MLITRSKQKSTACGKIDLHKLASTIGNKDIENLELSGWGFFDHPGACMLYDPDNRDVYFSTEMIQSEADADASYAHFKAYQQECINNSGTAKNIFGVAASLAIFVGIAAAILCIPIKKYEYIPWIVGAVMVVLGIAPFVPSTPRKASGFAESLLCQRIGGVISLLGAAGLISVHFLYPRNNMLLYVLALACEIAIVVFLAMLVKTIGYVTALP